LETDNAESYLMLTECGLSSRLQVEMPNVKFVGSCSMCKYMKANTLEDILRVLENPEEKDYIHIEEDVRMKAMECIEKMFEYAEK
jgi:quinolinate synthase